MSSLPFSALVSTYRFHCLIRNIPPRKQCLVVVINRAIDQPVPCAEQKEAALVEKTKFLSLLALKYKTYPISRAEETWE